MLVVLALLSAACWKSWSTSHSRAGSAFSEGGTEACPPPKGKIGRLEYRHCMSEETI